MSDVALKHGQFCQFCQTRPVINQYGQSVISMDGSLRTRVETKRSLVNSRTPAETRACTGHQYRHDLSAGWGGARVMGAVPWWCHVYTVRVPDLTKSPQIIMKFREIPRNLKNNHDFLIIS